MKKLISVLLCVAMLISAFAVFSYAVDDKGSTQSPVIDGKVDAGEYISERVYDNTDPNTGLPTSGNHVNFAAGCVPADGVSIIEYASEDDDNIYIAFVINQDFSSSYMAMTGRREAAATVKEMLNVTMIDFDFEDGEDETEGVVSGSAGLDGSSTDTDGTEMRAYRASEFDSIAKRNKNGDVFENITIEMKFSKKAIQDVCGVDSVEFIAYRFLYSPTAGGGNKELCSRPLYVSKATSGFATFEELADCYVDDEEFDFYNDGGRGGWKMLRFICFYEEPEVKAWYGPEGTVSSTGVQRAAVLDYTNFGRCGATSTYVTVKENEPPTVDGVVRCGEYTSSKIYNKSNHFTNWADKSVTVTEYVAHDSEYVYFALVYNTDMSSIDVRMNGQARVRYDLAATEYIYQFIYDFASAGTEKVNVSPSRTNFDTYHVFNSGEYEGVGAKNKSNGQIVGTTVELKLSKSAMKRVFEVNSVDYFGYYGESTTAAGSAITNAAVFNNAGLDACEWNKSSDLLAAKYGLNKSNYKGRIMNIVVLNESLSETVPVYCSDEYYCTYEGHAHRADKFDFSNSESLGRLASNYIPEKIATAPTLNGDIGDGEYTNYRQIQNTLEYAAHDDDYIYLGFINPDNGASYFEIFINAKDNVFDTASTSNPYNQIQVTVSGASTIAANSGGTLAYNTDYWTSMVRTDGLQIVEIKLSKASMRTAFNTDLERGFGYWARYHVGSNWTEIVDPITQYSGFSNAEDLSAAYGGVTIGTGTRFMNFIMFEEAPEYPAVYCPADDVCTHENHANRALTFDFSNSEDLGRLPSTYLTTNIATAPAQDGVITGGEYTSAPKTYTSGHVVKYNDASTVYNETVVEYAAQDENYVYLAFISPQGNWRTDLFLDASSDIFGSIKDKCDRCLQIRIEPSSVSQNTLSVSRSLTVDGENPELVVSCVRNGTNNVIEIKMSKTALKSVFQTETLRGLGYNFRYLASNDAIASSQITSYGGYSSLDELVAAYGVTAPHATFLSGTNMFYNFVMFEEAPEAPAAYCRGISADELSRRAEKFDIADMRCLNLLPGHFVPTQLRTPQVTPTVDGVVEAYEYTSSKFYPTANFNTQQAGVTLTEYISHDDDYVYMALVFNTNMSSIDVRMNGKSTVTSDWAQAEYIYYFNATSLGSVDEQKIVGSRGSFATSFAESEYEGIAKKNKNGDTVVSTTFELKLSKEGMKRVFEVSSVDYFGYYANGAAPSGTVTAATRIPNDGLTACGFGTSSQAMADEYGFDRGQYGSKVRLMNFVIFDEDPGMKYYCPAADSCTAAHHSKRSDTFDLTDMRCLYCLPSHYVPNKINADVQTPAQDGVIKSGEYTNKKVYDAAHCSNAPTNASATVTEYVSQDADWVYIALVYTENIVSVNFRMNAKADTRSVQTSATESLDFNFSLAKLDGSTITEYVDETTATCSMNYFSRAFKSAEFTGTARRNKIGTTFKDVTAELKLSKEAIKDIFGVESVDHIAYYAVAGKVVAGTDGAADTTSGDITNAARMTNSALTACGFSASSANLAAAYSNFSADNYGTRDGWRLWNFIVFDEAPAEYNVYCPASSCSHANHSKRATAIDYADMSALGCLPANYVPTVLDNAEKADVFTVDISFGSMSFDYVGDGVGEWDPTTHEHAFVPAHWECDDGENKITVANGSDFAILTSFIYKNSEGFENITGVFDSAVAHLVAAKDGTENATVDAYLTLDGEFNPSYHDGTQLGQVTVKLTKANS